MKENAIILKESVLLGCDIRHFMIQSERSKENSETNHPLLSGRNPELNTQTNSHESLQKRRQILLKCNKSTNYLFFLTHVWEIRLNSHVSLGK